MRRSNTSRNFKKYSNGMLTSLSSKKNTNNGSNNTLYKSAKSIKNSSSSSNSPKSSPSRSRSRSRSRSPNNRGSFYPATKNNIKKHNNLRRTQKKSNNSKFINKKIRLIRTESGHNIKGISNRIKSIN